MATSNQEITLTTESTTESTDPIIEMEETTQEPQEAEPVLIQASEVDEEIEGMNKNSTLLELHKELITSQRKYIKLLELCMEGKNPVKEQDSMPRKCNKIHRNTAEKQRCSTILHEEAYFRSQPEEHQMCSRGTTAYWRKWVNDNRHNDTIIKQSYYGNSG